ncbi:MAG TPA: hypothetical protein VG105_12875 [Paraburkholderia sp.]|jgi:hypothetical protein|nr:hypothetical protein [Paraburkholderia sp.]
MKTLSIKDLAVTEELDSRAMSAMRGGLLPYFPVSNTFVLDASKNVNATQLISQGMSITSANGNNVAFATDLHTKIEPHQSANNNINVL